nr:MAG TPA: hypothetical protein [Caudoviricetes sp.]
MAKDLSKVFGKINVETALKEAIQETADSMVDEIVNQAVEAIRQEAVVFIETRREELIKELQAEIETTANYNIKIRNRVYIFLLTMASSFIVSLEKRFSEKLRAQQG